MIHSFSRSFGRVTLKPLMKGDIEKLRILRNMPDNRKWFIHSNIISSQDQVNWFKRYLSSNDDIMFSVFERSNSNKFIGAVALYNIDVKDLSAEFGRLIIDSKNTIERGLGYDTTMCALEIGFKSLNFEKIHLEVFSDNYTALKIYEKAGFKKISDGFTEEIIYMEIEKWRYLLHGNSIIQTNISHI